MTMRSWIQTTTVSVLGLLLHGDRATERAMPPLMAELVAAVPEAAEVLAFSGGGFPPSSAIAGQSDRSPAPGQSAARTLAVRLPAATSREFSLGAVGSRAQVSFTLAGARAVPLAIEEGRGVYRSAYDGVDVIAARDPGHFELAFVVHEPSRAPELALDIAAPDVGVDVDVEPQSGAAIVRNDAGRPILRIEPPVAFDAAGVRRSGKYDLRGSRLALALNVSDLTPPVLVDPRFTIPFWTLVSDGRAPGSLTYDAATGSREIRLAFDAARGKTVLIRSVRTQQREDTVGLYGKLAYAQLFNVAPPSQHVRIAPDGSVQSGAAERNDWTRTFFVQSETWEWNGNGWDLTPATGLPGLIDPALAYDATRQRLVATSGAFPDFACRNVRFAFGITNVVTCELDGTNATYEFGAPGWQARAFSAAPPPRVRAALAHFPPYMVLFGGRGLEPPPGNPSVEVYGPPYPDNLARVLLNDTWRYDGERWERLPSANPPPARENATLIFDERRRRLVLVGGVDAGLDLWEFDGVDWIERIRAGDPSLPLSLRSRSKMLAVWNPARQTTLLFGGVAKKLESCTLSDALIAQRRNDPEQVDALEAAGCLGGYVHDSWEWDGQELRQLTTAAYGGSAGGMPVFRQIEGAASWVTSGAPPQPGSAPSSTPPLLPWRYDRDPDHFRLRTKLERAHSPSDLPGARVGLPSSPPVPSTEPEPEDPEFASPLFAAAAQPDMIFDSVRSKALIVHPESGRVFETDGAEWTERTPESSPFAAGAQDFFGATWDSAAQRVLLFDPRTGRTWAEAGAQGWQLLEPLESPPDWGIDPEVRRERDVPQLSVRVDAAVDRFTDIAKRAPQMTFDRARARAVMLYDEGLWEFDGASWSRYPAPPDWETCESATLLAYDGLRARVVAVGCRLPGETMEWDGSEWHGPFPGPYTELFTRAESYGNVRLRWRGTLQLAWSHPNALFESPLLGGVSTFDARGALMTWNGSTWEAGPQLYEGHNCDWSVEIPFLDDGSPVNKSHMFARHRDFVPLCFFPPAVEDGANNRVLAFRDGATGLRELRVTEPGAIWERAALGDLYDSSVRMHPHPFELASAEHVLLRTHTDPGSIELLDPNSGLPSGIPVSLPRDADRVPESLVNNLFWPFRILPDPTTQRIRVLSHRGALWELGSELRKGRGAACENTADCLEGFCSPEGVCCDTPCDRSCQTCNGSQPGRCESIAAGEPDPLSRCGQGQCAGLCSGGSQPHCLYDATRSCGPEASCADGVITPRGQCSSTGPSCVTTAIAPQPCAGGLECQDSTSCKTTCTARTDCTSPYAECAPGGAGCQPDAVSVAASARGVQPSDWEPEVRRTPEEVAQLFRQLGFEADEQGRILFPGLAMGGVIPAFDPNLHTPMIGFRRCMERIQACRVLTREVDACVASMPRCASTTPWLDDPAGLDCCPAECLSEYFEKRTSQAPGKALIDLSQSLCYPGLESYLENLR